VDLAFATVVTAGSKSECAPAEFLRQIMRPGCARYSGFFGGRKVMYSGRDGDFFTGPFTAPAKQYGFSHLPSRQASVIAPSL
jgi:hypothetical protein